MEGSEIDTNGSIPESSQNKTLVLGRCLVITRTVQVISAYSLNLDCPELLPTPLLILDLKVLFLLESAA